VNYSTCMKRVFYAALIISSLLVSCPKAPTAACGFDPCRLTVTFEPNTLKIEKGNAGVLALKVTTDNGYVGPLELRLGDLPSGVTVAVTPSKTNLGGDNKTFAGVVSVSTSSATVVPPDPQEIKVYALGNGVSSFGAFKLTLVPSTLAPPKAPTGFAVIALAGTEIKLFWNLSVGASVYTLERRTGSEAYGPLASPDSITTGYDDSGLTGNTLYTYRLTAINAGGPSQSVETSATTAIVPVVGRVPKP
jgi:hypothetical protein